MSKCNVCHFALLQTAMCVYHKWLCTLCYGVYNVWYRMTMNEMYVSYGCTLCNATCRNLCQNKTLTLATWRSPRSPSNPMFSTVPQPRPASMTRWLAAGEFLVCTDCTLEKKWFIESSLFNCVLCGTVCNLFIVVLRRWTQAIHRTHTERVSDSSRPMSEVHIHFTNSCVCMYAWKLLVDWAVLTHTIYSFACNTHVCTTAVLPGLNNSDATTSTGANSISRCYSTTKRSLGHHPGSCSKTSPCLLDRYWILKSSSGRRI